MSEQKQTSLSDIISKLASLQKDVHTTSSEISILKEDMLCSAKDIDSRVNKSPAWDLRYKDFNAIPGARTPKWYTLDLDFDSRETQSKSRSLEISPDGVFVCQQIQAYYLVLDETVSNYWTFNQDENIPSSQDFIGAFGRYIPCSAALPLMKGIFRNYLLDAPTTPLAPATGALNTMYEIPEFSFQFESSSASKNWCNKPIPAAFLYGLYEPLQTNGFLYLQRNERLIVTAKPETRVPLTGRVRVVLHGYQILGNVDVDKFLGV